MDVEGARKIIAQRRAEVIHGHCAERFLSLDFGGHGLSFMSEFGRLPSGARPTSCHTTRTIAASRAAKRVRFTVNLPEFSSYRLLRIGSFCVGSNPQARRFLCSNCRNACQPN